MNETQFQQQIVDIAHLLGWRHLHIRRSIGKKKQWVTSTNIVGWPDLFCFHPKHGFVALELKVGRNQPTAEQLEVLAELGAAGARTMVAWPDDIDRVISLLGGRFHDEAAA